MEIGEKWFGIDCESLEEFDEECTEYPYYGLLDHKRAPIKVADQPLSRTKTCEIGMRSLRGFRGLLFATVKTRFLIELFY